MSNGGKLKIVMLGSSTVGKTCLVDRFVYSTFSPTKNTVGMAFTTRDIELEDGTTVPAGIWDTAGQERFEATLQQYYRDADASLICFNPCEPQSWTKAKYWVEELLEMVPDCVICLVAMKSDLWDPTLNPSPAIKTRSVSSNAAKKFARLMKIAYFECSSKLNKGVIEPFTYAAKEASIITAAQPKSKPAQVNLTQTNVATPNSTGNSSGSGGCC